MRIWIIDEGSPGHLSQSVGLVDALSALTPVESIILKGRTQVRGWIRHAIRFWMGAYGRSLSDEALSKISDFDGCAEAGPPEMIISSGGKSVFVGLALSKRFQVPYVFVGERKPYPETWFHTVVSPVPGESSAKTIDVELIPTPVATNVEIRSAAKDPNVWCMIIGGASRSHHFTDTDWIMLAEGINALARSAGIRWRVTTSRRTGAGAEAILRKHLDASCIEDAIWWAEAPRRELYRFMASSEVLFVTQDSVTMVTEAVSAARPVVVVRPAETVFSKDSFLPEYFDRLKVNQRIFRVDTNNLASVDLSGFEFKLLEDDLLGPVAAALLKRL